MAEVRSPELDKHIRIPVAPEDPLKNGGKMEYRVWVCRQPGNKTDGVVNFGQCLRVKRTLPNETARPKCKEHPQHGMNRSSAVYRMPDGKLVRYSS